MAGLPAASTGLNVETLKKMLPVLAMMAAGYVMKNAGKGGGFGSALGRQDSNESADAGPQAQPAGSGDVLGELIGAAGKFLGR